MLDRRLGHPILKGSQDDPEILFLFGSPCAHDYPAALTQAGETLGLRARARDAPQSGCIGSPMDLLLGSQGLEKEEFRRLIVIFLTAIDFFLTFGYYFLVGLISTEMLIFSLRFIPAMILGFSRKPGLRQGERGPLQTSDPGHTLAAGAFLLWSTWG